jgi:hypothetical protein
MLLPELTAEESKALLLSVGTHHGHRPLSPVEVAKLFKKAISNGASREQCASFAHLEGPDMISRFLRLLELPSFVQHSTDWRQTGPTISFTSAWKLTVLPKEEQEETCVEIMVNQLRTKEVEQVVQLRQRSGRKASDCLREVVRMRPTVERVHVILGAVTDTKVKEWLSNQTQVQRDRLFEQLLAQTYHDAHKCSGRLGIDRFTIVTDDQGYTIVNPGRDGSFESVITQSLSKKMSS